MSSEYREEFLKIIKDFRLIDDEFFTVCLDQNIECVELILHIILERTDLKVTEARTQYTINHLLRRGVRLDIRAEDAKGRLYDIEIQRQDRGADPKRARFNSSVIDTDMAKRGMKFSQLPENYVIFITENDYWKLGKPVYRFERYCNEYGLSFGDGSHIIYVNGAYRDDSPVGRLMADFCCADPERVSYPALKRHIHYYKNDSEGVTKMCKAMKDFTDKLIQEKEKETSVKNAIGLLSIGVSHEMVAKGLGLTLEEVQAIASEHNIKINN